MTRHFHADTLIDDSLESHLCYIREGDNPSEAKLMHIRFLRSEKTAWLDADLDYADAEDMEEAHDTAISDINGFDGSTSHVETSITTPDGLECTYRITAVSVDCVAS